jgi:hypothetical protein
MPALQAAPTKARSEFRATDSLQFISAGLHRITRDCWNAFEPLEARPKDEALPHWYLRVASFNHNPYVAIKSLFKDGRLDELLVWLQVHKSVALAKEVERRLRSPLVKLAKLSFRSCQIMNGNWWGGEGETVWRPAVFAEVERHLERGWFNNGAQKKMADEVLDGYFGIRNGFRDAVSYLRSLHTMVDDPQVATSRDVAGPPLWPSAASALDLAKLIGEESRMVEAFLRRHRKKYPDCAHAVDCPRKGESRFLYRTADVRSALEDWQKRRSRAARQKI